VGRKEIVEVAACPIATDAINAALPSAYGALRARKAEVKKDGTLNFRESVAEDGAISVITDFNSPAFEEVNSVRYEFISGEFFQVNRSILADFSDYVLSGVVTPYLVDAYCGVGFFALQAARKCQRVWGVEVNKVAVESAQRNARANQIENVEFVEGSAEAIFENITAPAVETTVLMDPSRKGATEAFLDQLLGFGPARIVYVACSPETQARDVRYLIERGYRLSSLRGADLFPQTRHIEGIALLERK
jgi:tRNA/tmRNA/rRNA uracil-C5-methylase (TrmA/RlmC/RlmD family)